ncbi:MAG TPA: IS200/IS605 family transposase [Bacteroidales bacterium]|nr:IS200/IS605 family transposase [Bacteroidales bacterium]
MSYTKILIHAVWATKDRKKFLQNENMATMRDHISAYAKTKDIHIINVNGFENHIHCFISMSSHQNIATIMNLIKGESSHWANKNLKMTEKFGWQDDYFAVSVSQSQFNVVNEYINNQYEHHHIKSFQEEYDEFIKDYNFED